MKRAVVLSAGLALLAPLVAAHAAERPRAADNWSDAPVADWPTNTLSRLTATPRLVQPQQTDVSPGSRFAVYCQRISPLSIDTANTSSAPVLT